MTCPFPLLGKVQEKLKEWSASELQKKKKVNIKYVDWYSTGLAEFTPLPHPPGQGRWGDDKLCSLYSPKILCSLKGGRRQLRM